MATPQSLQEITRQLHDARIAREQERKQKFDDFFEQMKREDATELRLFPAGNSSSTPASTPSGSTIVVAPADAAALPAPATPAKQEASGQVALPPPAGFVMGPDGKAKAV